VFYILEGCVSAGGGGFNRKGRCSPEGHATAASGDLRVLVHIDTIASTAELGGIARAGHGAVGRGGECAGLGNSGAAVALGAVLDAEEVVPGASRSAGFNGVVRAEGRGRGAECTSRDGVGPTSDAVPVAHALDGDRRADSCVHRQPPARATHGLGVSGTRHGAFGVDGHGTQLVAAVTLECVLAPARLWKTTG
jgi:hypothetical protein